MYLGVRDGSCIDWNEHEETARRWHVLSLDWVTRVSTLIKTELYTKHVCIFPYVSYALLKN